MTPGLQLVLDFVEGRIEPRDFEQILYNDPSVESLLSKPRVEYSSEGVNTTLYLFLVEQDYGDPSDVLNAHGALCDYLKRESILHVAVTKYDDIYNLILEATPDWLWADPKYVQNEILSNADGRTGDHLKAWLTNELLERFRFLTSPPDWVQSPDGWPIGTNGPYVFIGQIRVNRYFHDEGTVYVFHDASSGDFKTFAQVM